MFCEQNFLKIFSSNMELLTKPSEVYSEPADPPEAIYNEIDETLL